MKAQRDHVRALTASDRDAWGRLWAQYNAFYGRSGDTALAPEIVTCAWERLLAPDEPVFCIVAELDGELVGLAHYLFHRSMIQIASTCYLQDLYTAEGARGRGIATRLIDAVGRACRDQGVETIYWHTHESNVTARRVYNRVATNTGFLVYRRPA